MEGNFAVQLKDGYVELTEKYNESLNDVLFSGFGMTYAEVYFFLSEKEKKAY